MSWFEIMSMTIVVGIFWAWLDSSRAHEIAVEHARAKCHADGMQFLDFTVAIEKLKPERDEDGHLKLKRTYTFEYSDTGNNRLPGSIVLLGQRVQFVRAGMQVLSETSPSANFPHQN